MPPVGIAMLNVLERLGHRVDFPAGQTCCGQPAFNTGSFPEAKNVAQHFLKTFRDAELIGVPSASCTTMIRVFYPELFEGEPELSVAGAVASRTFEFSELLVDRLDVTDVGATLDGVATFHDGCHGLRELGIKTAPGNCSTMFRSFRWSKWTRPNRVVDSGERSASSSLKSRLRWLK